MSFGLSPLGTRPLGLGPAPTGGGGPVTHDTTGALTNAGATLAGAATLRKLHATSGTLANAGAVIAASAARTRAHPTSGVLANAGAVVVGSAARAGGATTHATTGALVSGNSLLSGSAARTRAHPTSGVLAGSGALVVGSAARSGPTAHATTGTLAGAGAVIAGSARIATHHTSGALAGGGAVITGSAVGGGEDFASSAVFYVPLRMVSGLWSTAGVSASIPADKQAWLPPIRQPIAYVDQRDGRTYCDPAWYRAFEFIFETRLGGRLGPSIPDVVSTVAATQETAAAASATISEVAQQTQANAEALFVVREVVQGGALDGADQIPGVDLR